MGMSKWNHIRTMLNDPALASQWQTAQGSHADGAATDAICKIFVPIDEEVVAQYATLVPCGRAAIDQLRTMGLNRLDHRSYPLDHGTRHARRRRPRLCARQPGVR